MQTRTRMIAAMSGLALGAMLTGMAPSVKHEMGADRAAASEIEGRPIADKLGSLTDWSHRGVLDASNTDGKVVVLALVSAGEPKSWMTISKLTRMQREFERQGIVIAAIHPDAGWEMMQEKIDAGRVSIPVARDAGNAFASAVHADDYPDLYVIDRAGNLRYADVDQRSIEDAISELVKEDTELAMSNAQLQREGKAIVAPEPEIREASSIPAREYDSASWPAVNTVSVYAENDLQGQSLPFTVEDHAEWIDNERDLEGKILVLDFWATWCGPCKALMPTLHDLQDEFGGKVEIVGIGGSEPKADFMKYVLKKNGNYAQLFDETKAMSREIGIKGIPHILIVSTDGVVRWQGFPSERVLRETVAAVVEADPMFKD